MLHVHPKKRNCSKRASEVTTRVQIPLLLASSPELDHVFTKYYNEQRSFVSQGLVAGSDTRVCNRFFF